MPSKLTIAAGLALLAGGVAATLFATSNKETVCVMRPEGASPATCLRNAPTLGVIDFGDENVFRQSEAVGDGCVVVPCAK